MVSHPTLYDRTAELDACGIGFVADARGRASREILDALLEALRRVKHRGAVAADGKTGDGAGLLMPIPSTLLPSVGCGIGMVFLRDDADRERLAASCLEQGLDVLGWREVPVDPDALGAEARASLPRIEQLLIAAPGLDADEAERRAFRARKRRGAVARLLRRLALVPDGHVQSSLRRRPAGGVLRRPPRPGRRGSLRRLPPALLDQHGAVVGARPAVPSPLPQRRDQRDPGERELDARARGQARLGRRRLARACRRPARARTRRCSTTSSSCSSGAAATSATRWRCSSRRRGRRTSSSTRRCATSTATTPGSASRGTGRPRSSSRTATSWARRSTATGCVRSATRSEAISSSARRRQAWLICPRDPCVVDGLGRGR